MLRLLLIALIFSTSLVFSQEELTPCPRNQPVTAFHIKKNKVFLFGGYCSTEKKRLNDLWEFDGKSWRSISLAVAPEPRSGHAMIYDSVRDRLVVFGGKNEKGDLLNDLWAWNGTAWIQISEGGPAPRQSHRIIFNTDNGDIFLFGGSNLEGQSLDDTWLYGNEKWVKLNHQGSPPSRLQHAMAYDQQRKRIVLFGGFDRTVQGKVIYGDTWEWDSAQGWKLRSNREGMARDHHAMVYDPELKSTVLFAGYNQGYLGDTWSWKGEEWELRTTDGPARAGKPGLMYDNLKKSVILFGGGNDVNMHLMDFWKFNGSTNQWSMYSKN